MVSGRSSRERGGLVRVVCVALLLLLAQGWPAPAQQTQPLPADPSWTYELIIKLAKQRLAQARTQARTPHDPVLVPPLQLLAATYETRGAYAKAVQHYREILAIFEARYQVQRAQGTADLVFILTKLAMVLSDHGNIHAAEAAAKRALQLHARDRARQRVGVADLLNNLATIYQGQGRYAEALPLAERAVELSRAQGDARAQGVFYNNLAELHVHFERLDKAEQLHRKALHLRQKHGADSIAVAISYNNIAGVNFFQKRYRDAVANYRRALHLVQQDRGHRHPLVAQILNNMGELYREQNSLDEALRYHEQALAIRQQVLGRGHPDVGGSLNNLAKIYLTQKDYGKALAYALQTLAIDEKTRRPGHPDLARSLRRVAEIYGKLGKTEKVRHYMARVAALPPPGTRHVPLYFATNRIARATPASARQVDFLPEDGGRLQLGRAVAVVPDIAVKRQARRRAQSLGLLDKASGRLTQAAALRIKRVTPLVDMTAFARQARQSLRLAGTFKNEALIFLHGYNVDFNEALLRAAQISFDLEFDGLLMPYSWPSQGRLAAYAQDEKSAARAARHLRRFLQDLARHMPGLKVHFLAHSMGSRVLLKALFEQARDDAAWRQTFGTLRLGEVIWAHPDVAAKTFAERTRALAARGVAMTLYSSKTDLALWASRMLHGQSRAGDALAGGPGIDHIDITGMRAVGQRWFDLSLNHNVFVRNPALFGEITRLLLTGQRPVHHRSPDFAPERLRGRVIWRYRPWQPGKP